MRIGVVTQWYPPENPAIAGRTMAHALADRGHEVHVVTGFPNYPDGVLYPGYSLRPYLREVDGDVTVHRGPLVPSHDRSAVRRATNYLSFAAGGTWAAARVPRPDAWITNGTPVTAAVPATVWSQMYGVPHAIVVQDLWPESVTESAFLGDRANRVVDTVLRPASTAIYRAADAVGVISPGMRGVLERRGVDPQGICYTPNAVGDSHLLTGRVDRAALRRTLGLPENGLLFMYAGNLGELQCLDNLIAAFGAVPSAQLVLVGSGVARDRLAAQASALPNVTVIDRQPLDKIGTYLAASDVQVVSLADSPLLRVTMPSKVQTSLAVGRPILAHAAGDAATVVEELGAGIATPPDDPARTRLAIESFARRARSELEQMGATAREAYERTYTPAKTGKRLESLLSTAVERKNSD